MAKSIIIDPEKYANLLIRDLEKARAEGYRAGRIAALREVGCLYKLIRGQEYDTNYNAVSLDRLCDQHRQVWDQPGYHYPCRVCRLLAKAESGEQEKAE